MRKGRQRCPIRWLVVSLGFVLIAVSPAHARLLRRSFFSVGGQPVFVLSETSERSLTQTAFNQSFNLFQKPSSICHLWLYSEGPGLEEDYYFFADEAMGLVRAIRLENGLPDNIYSFIPTGANAFNGPSSITVGPNGYTSPHRLFILDSGNNRIRRLKVTSAQWPPVDEGNIYYGVGDPTYGPLNNPRDVDYCTLWADQDIANDLLVVADTGNHRILGMRPSGAVLWSIGGPASGNGIGQFCFPYAATAVAMAPNTDEALIYVADRGNHRVVQLRQFYENGQWHVVWQRSLSMHNLPGIKPSPNSISQSWIGYSGLSDIEVDPSGRDAGVFVLDSSRRMVIQLDWGLRAVLATQEDFEDDNASLYDLEVSDNNVAVVYSYTAKGGSELFFYEASVEGLRCSPTAVKTPLEYATVSMAITGGGMLDVWVTNGTQTVASITGDNPIEVRPGLHYEVWDGTDDDDDYVSPGNYFIKTRLVDAWTGEVDLRTIPISVVAAPSAKLIGQDTNLAHPDWSPDGESIVYSGGNYIKVYEFASGTTTTLTSGAGGTRHTYPSFNVDGTKIAWSKMTGAEGTLQVMNADGSNIVGFSPGGTEYIIDVNPVWDPTGKYLSYVDQFVEGQNKIRRFQLNNGMPVQPPALLISANGQVGMHVWSPWGTRVACSGTSRIP